MKAIYEMMKNKGHEEDIKKWRDPWDWTVLMEATYSGSVEVVEWLLGEVKVDPNEQIPNGECALHFATKKNQVSCAHALLRHQAALLSYEDLVTPLDVAKLHGYEEMENLLKSHFNLE